MQSADSQALVTPGPLTGQGQVKDSDFQKIRRSCPLFFLMSGKKVSWVWASFWSWWWTGKPGVLQSMGLQKVGHDWGTELKKLSTSRNSETLPTMKNLLLKVEAEQREQKAEWRSRQEAPGLRDLAGCLSTIRFCFQLDWFCPPAPCLVCSSVWHADNYIAVLIDGIIESHTVRLFHEFVPINSSV